MEKLEEILSGLSGSKLTSLLLKVFEKRSQKANAARLLEEWETNPLFRLAKTPYSLLRRLEDICLAETSGFEILELPPFAPFGTVSALAPVSQNHVFSSVRGTELVADSTNVLALEAASRRRSRNEIAHLGAFHRLARGQKFRDPSYLAHFVVFSLVSAGRDEGHNAFERNLAGHLQVYLSVLSRWAPGAKRKVTFFSQGLPPIEGLAEQVGGADCEAAWREKRPSGNGYYPAYSFSLGLETRKGVLPIADGGVVDWTQKLLQNRKERLLISGLGLDMLAQNTEAPV